MDIGSILKLLVTGLQDIQTTRYAYISSSTVIIFDHLITFDDEVSLIWGSAWSVGKILFLINRYYTLAAVIFNNYALFSATLTDKFCLHMIHWQGWTGLIECVIAEAILFLRIYALYSSNKKVISFMLITCLVCSACSAWIMGSVLSSVSVTSFLPTGGRFCIAYNIPRRFFTFWIPILAYECLLCGLALFQGLRTFRLGGSIFRSGKGLVGILVRDSVLYFIALGTTYLTCLLVWVIARPTLLEVPIGFSVAMSCVLANRVMFNVRKTRSSVHFPVMVKASSVRNINDEHIRWRRTKETPCTTQDFDAA